jgi:uncharacterized FlaG/YvyC family protein
MNNARRKQIASIKTEIEEKLSLLQELQEEEQDYFDNMPENLQYSERGEKAEQAADDLQNIIDEIQSQLEELETVIE